MHHFSRFYIGILFVLLSSCGGGGGNNSAENQTPANSPPSITSGDSATAKENSAVTHYTATATDPDGDNIRFSLTGGDDQSLFTIDAITGVLAFISEPDFEAPEDADTNNNYEITLTADDGNGGTALQNISVTVTDETLVSINLSYPTPNADLGGEVTQTSVTGYLTDEEDGELLEMDFGMLTVNDVIATFELDDPSRWKAQIPIENFGSTEIHIELEGSNSNITELTHNIENNVTFRNPGDITLDTDHNRALITNGVPGALFAVDLITGMRTALSDNNKGSGPGFVWPRDVTLDRVNNRALVIDTRLPGLFAVDLATGNRSVLSDSSNGSGPNFDSPGDITLDSTHNRALVIDPSLDALISVDLATGNRTLLSDSSNGSGLNFVNPADITLDSVNNRALVVDASLPGVFSVDLVTGNRTVLSDNSTGSTPLFISPSLITLDSANNRVLIQDRTLDLPVDDALIAVDLNSGNRTLISNNSNSGPHIARPTGITLDSAQNRILLIEQQLEALLAIDLATGNHTVLSESSTIGSGPRLISPNAIALDSAHNRVLIPDNSIDALVAIDLDTGNRAVLSDNSNGSGSIWDITLDSANNRALIIESFSAAIIGTNYQALEAGLLAIDLDTGNRIVLSDDSIGSGPSLSFPVSITLDITNNRVLVISKLSYISAGLFSVDLATGNRTVLSDDNIGSGPLFENPSSITLDIANNRALVIDRGLEGLFAVDLTTGNRTILSDDSTGSGPNFDNPHSIVLDIANNRALVTSSPTYGNSAILLAVDLANGNRTALAGAVLSNYSAGSGPDFRSAGDLTLDRENNRAIFVAALDYFVENIAIIVVELDSGERVISSR